MLSELFVSKYNSFFQSIHAFADFQVDIVFRIETIVGNVVSVEDFLGDVAAMQVHVLVDVSPPTVIRMQYTSTLFSRTVQKTFA